MVSLGAIEDAILSVCAVKNWHLQQDGPTLAICAKELAGEKTKIHLFTRFKATLEEVNQVLKEAGFSNLLRLSSVICVPEIPILGTGKVNYRALESSYLS